MRKSPTTIPLPLRKLIVMQIQLHFQIAATAPMWPLSTDQGLSITSWTTSLSIEICVPLPLLPYCCTGILNNLIILTAWPCGDRLSHAGLALVSTVSSNYFWDTIASFHPRFTSSHLLCTSLWKEWDWSCRSLSACWTSFSPSNLLQGEDSPQ